MNLKNTKKKSVESKKNKRNKKKIKTNNIQFSISFKKQNLITKNFNFYNNFFLV